MSNHGYKKVLFVVLLASMCMICVACSKGEQPEPAAPYSSEVQLKQLPEVKVGDRVPSDYFESKCFEVSAGTFSCGGEGIDVTIMNPEGIGGLEFGSTCALPHEHSAWIECLAKDNKGGRVLAKLSWRKHSNLCPSETIFFVPTEKFQVALMEYRSDKEKEEQRQKELQKDRETVKKLLGK